MSVGKVLVVDDETEIRELIVKYLRREGIQTAEATGGVPAVAQIIQQDCQSFLCGWATTARFVDKIIVAGFTMIALFTANFAIFCDG